VGEQQISWSYDHQLTYQHPELEIFNKINLIGALNITPNGIFAQYGNFTQYAELRHFI